MSEHIESSASPEKISDAFFPQYNLPETELKTLEAEMVACVEDAGVKDGIAALWVSPNRKYSNFVRTHEARYFPEVAEVSDDDEKNTVFLALVDTRNSSKRVVHGVTLMQPAGFDPEAVSVPTTGFYTIDSLIERGNFTAEEFYDYYRAKAVDVAKCLSVETNFRIGEKPELQNGLRLLDIAYIAIFQRLLAGKPELGEALVFATINNNQARSFERVGLQCEYIMGRNDLDTEEAEFGIESQPVTLTCDQFAYDLLTSMNAQVSHIIAE